MAPQSRKRASYSKQQEDEQQQRPGRKSTTKRARAPARPLEQEQQQQEQAQLSELHVQYKKTTPASLKKQWEERANLRMTPVELRRYRSYVNNDQRLINIEQLWVNAYLTPLLEFMGDIGPDGPWHRIPKTITETLRTCPRKRPPGDVNLAVFVGRDTGHWYSRKAGETVFFDPYTHYQVPSTNQFCQTFAMMHILDKLPPDQGNNRWFRYYDYTCSALSFIESVITGSYGDGLSSGERAHLKRCVKVCKTHPNICLNAIEIDFSSMPVQPKPTQQQKRQNQMKTTCP